MIDCLACLRQPRHSVDLGGGETVEFCEPCWAEVERRLDETSAQYRAMLASGVHPRMAERVLNERMGQTA